MQAWVSVDAPTIVFLPDLLITSKNVDSRYLLLYLFKSFLNLYIMLSLIYKRTPPLAASAVQCSML